MLNTNVKNYSIQLKDWREFWLTKNQYDVYKMEQEDRKFNDPLEIVDIDTWKMLFDWKWSEFKEFKQKADSNLWNKIYYCDFWRKHSITVLQQSDSCDCKKEFDVVPAFFKFRLKEMWYTLGDSKNITDEMRNAYINKYLKND